MNKKNRMLKRIKIFLIIFSIFALNIQVYAEKILKYNEITPKFTEVWNETYPISFHKILQKDLTGKGVMVLRNKQGNYYLYTFLVSIPRYYADEGKLTSDNDSVKKVVVKLYHEPFNLEKPYRIDLGEFTEKYNLNSARWIK